MTSAFWGRYCLPVWCVQIDADANARVQSLLSPTANILALGMDLSVFHLKMGQEFFLVSLLAAQSRMRRMVLELQDSFKP